jgi:hypothetical protein
VNSNKRHPEIVQVQLFNGENAGGLELVGTMTLSVPVKVREEIDPARLQLHVYLK